MQVLSLVLSLNNALLNNNLLKIKEQSLEYPTTNIIGHLNINSVRNKFNSLTEIIKNFNIFLILESKLDASFPKNQFKVNGYKCFRCDPNKYGGGFIFYLANQTALPDVEISLLDISLTF